MTEYHKEIEHKLKPRENQIIAINEMISGLLTYGFHGALLEMSLGKTKCSLNAGQVLHKRKGLKSIVIICAKAIQSVWLDEIPKHTNFKDAPIIWRNQHTKKFTRELHSMQERSIGIYLVGLELFSRKSPVIQEFLSSLFKAGPTLVILDESSKIKDVSTERAPRLIEYTRGAQYRLILTGTPWSESPLDIFSQMEFLKEGFWYKYTGEWKPSTLRKHWYIFRSRYAVMEQVTTSEGRSFKVVVGSRRTEEIAQKLAPYVTQQKKVDWVDLPDKVFQTLHIDMDPQHRAVYEELRDRLILEHGDEVLTVANAGILTLRLRQVAGGYFPGTEESITGKRPAGMDLLLEDVAEYPHKVIVVATFVAEIKGLVQALSEVYGEQNVCTYYGGTAHRDEELVRFKDSAKFLVLNPQTGAYGLNLQFTSLMYLYSRPFSYEQTAQLFERTHRPGQERVCVYKSIVHTGTVQAKPILSFLKKQRVVEEFDTLTAEAAGKTMTLKEYLS